MRTSERSNIVSVSWSDHLVFGEGDGRLATVQALVRRMEKWREELNAAIIHWRCTRGRIRGRFYAGRGHRHFFKAGRPDIDWDDFEVVPKVAHKYGMQVFLYVTLFDEDTPYELIRLVQPDILVKGKDYRAEDVVGYDIVTKNGGQVITLDLLEGYSTTAIEQKIRQSR